MPGNDHGFVAWEEHILCHERGNRVVHYFLKDSSEDLVLAVIGTERSIRHMMYVVAEEFVQAYGPLGSVNACTKWRARREVVEWLTSLVSRRCPEELSNSPTNDSTVALSMSGSSAHQTFLPDQMVSRKLKVQDSEIEWSGVAWICAKQLKHYPAFCRSETTIKVHSFVFIMALDDHQYLGYLEDMYEDKKGQKKVKVRWFHHNQEVKDVPQLNPHPSEVFITSHVQVISAECVDGPATVLTPKHFEKCVALVAHNSSSGIHMCYRQFKNNKLRPFTLAKLRGYSNQGILASLDANVVPKHKGKSSKLGGEDEEEFALDDPVRVGSKRNRNYKGKQGLEDGTLGVRSFASGNQATKGEPTYPKLKLRLPRKQMVTQVVGTESQLPVSFKVGDRIELLCQDSGIRGCWFQCKILKKSQKQLKVRYNDVEDAEGLGNLEEWVPASRVAAPDKLGMRCSGRLTIRPCPPKVLTDFPVEIGAPVDAWWCDGWWEGLITGVGISGPDTVQVYFPSEKRFLTFQKKDIRASKDWDGSRWVDTKTKPEILLHIPLNVSSSTKLSSASAVMCGSEIHKTSNPEVIDGRGKGLLDLASSIDRLKIVMDSTNSGIRPFINNKFEVNNLSGNKNANAGNGDKSG
ncbi:uncharacterized protein LOC21393879 [Morus notabilis]|uniref:uncharacterized protein LOC21393879 n=1 Tax=Morus notabilis TaxID=981085 RepID=UPI000CED52B2|nr:uncharacterized protein LOC21393879 [Morus notabilis]